MKDAAQVARVAWVVGRGAVSAFGAGAPALLEGVFDGRSGVRPRGRLAQVECLTSVAAEVPHECFEAGLPPALSLARRAAREALQDAGLAGADVALVLATTKADLSRGIARAGEHAAPWRLCQALAAELEAGEPRIAVSCACASGLAALAQGARWIRRGVARHVLVVGVDVLEPFVLQGFSSLLALDPLACRPFDVTRAGLSVGEGAGAMVLAAAPDQRQERSPRLCGFGASNDANHVTGPSRDGAGLARAMQRALDCAGCTPADVDLVHLHGTGTPYNDAMECHALRRVFEGAPVAPAAAGSKAQLGHTLGAAGVLESLVALEALARGVSPPNLRLEHVDPALEFPLSGASRPLPRAQTALKLAAGFGGIDWALVFQA